MPFAALLLAIAPTVTPEVVWRTASPLATYSPTPPAARVTADGDGYVVAWSEVEGGISRAYAARLNAAGRMAAAGVRTFGVADAPAIAPFGDRYIAAWIEPNPVDKRLELFTAALDRSFKVVASQNIGVTTGPPVVRTTATRAWIGSGGGLYEVNGDAAPIASYNLPQPLDDLAAFGNDTGYVHHERTVSSFIICRPTQCPSPPPPTPHYVLTFTWLFRLTETTRLQFDSASPAAVAPGGDKFLVLWAESKPTNALKATLVGASLTPFVVSFDFRDFSALDQPQAAWDGQRWVVVWNSGLTTPTSGEIRGAVITPDLTVTPFKVGNGRRPAIAAAGVGRFLVTYEVANEQQRQFVSRLIDFTPPGQRERVVR